MFKYAIKRIITFIPMLIAISLLSFVISINAPGDPIDRLAKSSESEGAAQQQSGASKKIRQELRKKLGLDLPIFYFSISDIASSDTLYKVQDRGQKANLEALTHQSGNWKAVSKYYLDLLEVQSIHQTIDQSKKEIITDSSRLNKATEAINKFGFEIGSLLETSDRKLVEAKFDTMINLVSKHNFLNPLNKSLNEAKDSRSDMFKNATKWKTYIPSINWYGAKNQYHLWLMGNMSYYPFKTIIKFKSIFKKKHEIPELFSEICKNRTDSIYYKEYLNSASYEEFKRISYENADSLYTVLYNQNINQIENLINTIKHPDGSIERNRRKGLLRGDFGISYIDNQPIQDKIWQKIGISFALSLISIFLAYLISIPIGIYSAYKKDSFADKGTSLILFILYSMPSFFVATLLLLQFANPDNFSWFPVSGIQDPTVFDPEWSFWEKIKHRMPYLILPIITYTYGSFAFLSRIMRVGMIDIVGQDYIRTARAKGLGENKVILKHALRNSLLPVITVFAAIFPAAIGGSIIIEVIFSIPGMGVEIYNSILNYDYPMIITVFTLSGFLTMIGYLVSDILYAIVDPRISYK